MWSPEHFFFALNFFALKMLRPGACVQVYGLDSHCVYNGERGVVRETKNKSRRVLVQLDRCSDSILVLPNKLRPVLCVGLPREYRMQVKHDRVDRNALARAISLVDSQKFYVFYMGETTIDDINCLHFVRVRLEFFRIAISYIPNRVPLVRFYIGDYSVQDTGAKIQYGDAMPYPDSSPAFVDVSSEQMKSLAMSLYTPPIDLVEANMKQELERIEFAQHASQAATKK